MVGFMQLPAPRMPQNALLDLEPISQAIDGNRRNALLQQESARQDQELAMRQAATGRAEARASRQDIEATKARIGKMALAGQSLTDPAQKARLLQEILREHPDQSSLGPEFRNPDTAFGLIAAQAGLAREQDAGRMFEVDGRIVQVGPSGPRTLYEAPAKPDPIRDMLAERLKRMGPQQPAPQANAPTVQPQSFTGAGAPAGLINIDERTQAPPPAMAEPANTINTPFGPMTREEAQQLGGAMLLDPKYQAAGKALLDSVQPGGNTLSKPAETQLDERTISAASTLGRLQEIRRANNPKFQQIPEKLKLAGASWGAALGAKLSPQMQKDLADYTKYRAAAFDNFNQILKELSGTAVSVQELQRQKIVQPNPGEGILDGDDPVTFESKLDQVERLQKAAIARMNFMRSRGVQFNKDTAEQFLRLEDVPAAMDRRGAEIEQQLRQQNPNADPMSIEREAMNQVRREFGI